ncbi:DUF1566 domain-containing protein [Cellulophaga baltica]|uniref:Lcl C-terminal domain-containing protein n=1 Tax=Cellulophaga TaxID=104264 RepID=UPI001C06F6CA|nr:MULTISPECIES: DUF1566 domain-containing protein [Cellulophaga]MBU2997253.1 DUF1566 domain-containing protein [Cellulophaga baltica]MDO6768651.1 DUF1566 domain-containing protein [Cellulophaga sp. 1_MG-2023]
MNSKIHRVAGCFAVILLVACNSSKKKEEIIPENEVQFVLTDTGQDKFYNDKGEEIAAPKEGEKYYGQDAQFIGIHPAYTDNNDGTITDINTGLMWQKTPDFERHNFYDAFKYVDTLEIGGYTDWRLPTIKELYSLLYSNGELNPQDLEASIPYIDTTYFDFEYDKRMPYAGQYWSSTKYVKGPIQNIKIEGAFGFNFADGHIKSYETGLYFDGTEGVHDPGNNIRAVRGKQNVYGVNDFVDNNNGTITDRATGLMWQKTDDGHTYNWVEALAVAEKSTLANHTNWRLPNTKELQSIVDYEKKTIPAIDENFFEVTNKDSWFWTSTTQGDFKYTACYIAFGKAYSKDNSAAKEYFDWHGAGAQRSDPKSGTIEEYLLESVNASDSIRIKNYVRLVRDSQ